MGLSLKKEEMAKFLEEIKTPGENFKTMLWGTIIADLPLIEGRTLASQIMVFTPAGGVAAMPNNAFCYIGLTEKSLYAIAVDAYDTSVIIGSFVFPFANMKELKVRKTIVGSHVIEVSSDDEYMSLTVKSISLGTNIKDQKERLAMFLQEIEAVKNEVMS